MTKYKQEDEQFHVVFTVPGCAYALRDLLPHKPDVKYDDWSHETSFRWFTSSPTVAEEMIYKPVIKYMKREQSKGTVQLYKTTRIIQ